MALWNLFHLLNIYGKILVKRNSLYTTGTDIQETYSQYLPWYVLVHLAFVFAFALSCYKICLFVTFLYSEYIGTNSCQHNSFFTTEQTFTKSYWLVLDPWYVHFCIKDYNLQLHNPTVSYAPFYFTFPFSETYREKYIVQFKIHLYHWTDIHKSYSQ